MRNGNFLKICVSEIHCVSEIRVKRIRVNQGLGVYKNSELKLLSTKYVLNLTENTQT